MAMILRSYSHNKYAKMLHLLSPFHWYQTLSHVGWYFQKKSFIWLFCTIARSFYKKITHIISRSFHSLPHWRKITASSSIAYPLPCSDISHFSTIWMMIMGGREQALSIFDCCMCQFTPPKCSQHQISTSFQCRALNFYMQLIYYNTRRPSKYEALKQTGARDPTISIFDCCMCQLYSSKMFVALSPCFFNAVPWIFTWSLFVIISGGHQNMDLLKWIGAREPTISIFDCCMCQFYSSKYLQHHISAIFQCRALNFYMQLICYN